MTVPVVVSATSLPLRLTALLGGAGRWRWRRCWCSSICRCPGIEGAPLPMPFIYVAGMWMAVFSLDRLHRASTPCGSPRKRGCSPTRLPPPNWCCSASSIFRRSTVWPRPPRTSSARRSPPSRWSPRRWSGRSATTRNYGEDVTLLRSQSERCREILKRLTSLSSEGEAHLARLPLTSLVEEVIAPHRDFGISIKLRAGRAHRPGAGRPPQSGRHLRARQSGRERRRLRPRERHRALALGRADVTFYDHRRRAAASRPKSSTASASPICRRGRAPSRRRAGARPVHRQDAARALGRHARFPQFERAGRGRRGADILAARACSSTRNRLRTSMFDTRLRFASAIGQWRSGTISA